MQDPGSRITDPASKLSAAHACTGALARLGRLCVLPGYLYICIIWLFGVLVTYFPPLIFRWSLIKPKASTLGHFGDRAARLGCLFGLTGHSIISKGSGSGVGIGVFLRPIWTFLL